MLISLTGNFGGQSLPLPITYSPPFTIVCYQGNKEVWLWNTFLRNLSEKLRGTKNYTG